MYITINGNKPSDVFVVKRYDIPSPKKTVDMIEIQDRTPLYIHRGYFNDITITVTMGFICVITSREELGRYCRNFFLNTVGSRLSFSDLSGKHYRIKDVTVSNVTTEGSQYNHFDVEFTCDPFLYEDSGLTEITPASTVTNAYTYESRPIYNIAGDGVCTLTVNGNTMKCNVGGNLTVDTELRLAYDGEDWENYNVSGDYDDLVLNVGSNTISITSGFTLKMIPNWRSL